MSTNEGTFIIGKDGMPHPVLTLFFKNMGELWDFRNWLDEEGSESFARYRESDRDFPEICTNCKWFDSHNFQCYDGHGQYIDRKDCEGFEEL